jgi:hypothetical protein
VNVTSFTQATTLTSQQCSSPRRATRGIHIRQTRVNLSQARLCLFPRVLKPFVVTLFFHLGDLRVQCSFFAQKGIAPDVGL